jgi:hypothetical protein
MGNSQKTGFSKKLDTYNKSKMYITNEHKIKLAEWERNEDSIKLVIVYMKIDDTEVVKAPQVFIGEYDRHAIYAIFRKDKDTKYIFSSIGVDAKIDDTYFDFYHEVDDILDDIRLTISQKFPKDETLTIE